MDRDTAERLMKHYFRTAFKAAGVGWDSDNDVEVEEMVDAIILTARQPLEGRIAELENEIAQRAVAVGE